MDMYSKKSDPEKSLLDFSLFVTFFPQLVAGPIVRPLNSFHNLNLLVRQTKNNSMKGLFLVSLGLFMKVVLADTLLASTSDAVFNFPAPLLALDAWMVYWLFQVRYFLTSLGIQHVPSE